MPRPWIYLLSLVFAARFGSALAHDIPNERVDRAFQVMLWPGRLEVAYEVSLAELTLVQDLRTLDGSVPGTDRMALYDLYGRTTGPLNARGLLVRLDGRPLDLRYESFDLAVEEHPRFTFHITAGLPARGRLRIRDSNYASSAGTSRLALRALGGLVIRGYEGPEVVARVPARPVWQLFDEEERRTKEVEVTFAPSAPVERLATATVVPAPSRLRPAAVPRAPAARSGLARLMDRRGGSLLGLLLMAFALGAAHAVQPGHGKTLVAATSVGERGGWSSGVLLALVTTFAHTGGVAGVALALWWTGSTRYGAINTALAGVAGFLIAAVGLWRLGRHLGGHGEHGPGDSETLPAADLGLRGIVGLGLAGGLVPCWDAVLLLLLAATLGRLLLGLALLAAFISAGMAAVLVAVGLLAGRLRGLVTPNDRADRWERRLGLTSSLTLATFGGVMLATA